MNMAIPFCLLLCFTLNPFVAFCFSLYLLAKRRWIFISSLVFILFSGLFGYTFLPAYNMDITRHYMIYEELTNIGSLADFVFYESLQDKPDFLLDMVYWWLGKFVNTHQIVGFIGAVFYYGLMLGVIRHFCIIFVNEDKAKAAFFYLLFLFLALTTIYEFSGMRQGNAILLFLFIITIPENKISEKCRALLLVLPGLLHFSLYPIVLLYLCTYWMRKKQV